VRLRGELEQNRNPRLIKRMARELAFTSVTVEDVIRDCHQKYCIGNKKNEAQIMRSFELYFQF